MNIHIYGSARRISFVKSIAQKRNPSGRTEYMNIHTPSVATRVYSIFIDEVLPSFSTPGERKIITLASVGIVRPRSSVVRALN